MRTLSSPLLPLAVLGLLPGISCLVLGYWLLPAGTIWADWSLESLSVLGLLAGVAYLVALIVYTLLGGAVAIVLAVICLLAKKKFPVALWLWVVTSFVLVLFLLGTLILVNSSYGF